MSVFKRLVKDTAIYGVSSIVARAINFFFVPLYTRVLSTSDYGAYGEIFAYIALLQVVLTFGLETGFFRFASKPDQNADTVFSTSLQFLFTTSTLFFIAVYCFSGNLAEWFGYSTDIIIYAAGILAIDCFTSVLFARLRFERKAWTFAIFRTVKILSEVLFNLLLFFVLPPYFAKNPDSFLLNFLSATPSFQYIVAAVFFSGVVSLLLFVPQLMKVKIKFSKEVLKNLLIYSLPLMIAGIPGVANDFIDRVLFRFFAPTDTPWLDQLGIFNANTKIAVIMMLFVQMFRYAAEPFFFSSSNQPNIKQVYAGIMKYFTAFCMIVFVFIMLYIDIFGLLLGKDFRSGIMVVPIVLLANVLLGINQNLSMWYKLSGKTNLAIVVTLSGLLATLLVNIIFMPVYGYYAAAFGHLASYLVMIAISAYLGRKYYPVPYQWGRVCLYILSGCAVYALSLLLPSTNLLFKLLINTVFLCVYVLFILKVEKINPLTIINKLIKR